VPAKRLTFTKGSDGVLGDDGMPDFSPNGRRIVFTSNRDRNGEIYVMNANGSGQRRLTHRAGDDFVPRFSPDGARIAFVTLPGTINVMNADGTGLRRLTTGTDVDWRPS
jgi:Tol biopolymer transport system component